MLESSFLCDQIAWSYSLSTTGTRAVYECRLFCGYRSTLYLSRNANTCTACVPLAVQVWYRKVSVGPLLTHNLSVWICKPTSGTGISISIGTGMTYIFEFLQ